MKIKKIKIEKDFKYLWLKYVEGINLNTHCANCLVGNYSKKIKKAKGTYENIFLDEYNTTKYYYLCGVSSPFVYENNFHLAFKYCKDELLKYSSNGIEIEIENAIALPISKKFIDIRHPKAKFKSYSSCRNWQFANYLRQVFQNNFN